MSAHALKAEATVAERYEDKPESYFSGARTDFVARLPLSHDATILEIGCGTGATGALAKARGRAGHYVGVEIHEPAAAQARNVLDQVLVGDVEHMSLPFRPAAFDALILSEVLEHLIEPWTLLERLSPLVRPGGTVLASSPNVAHWRVIASLLRGRFDLTDKGVLDRTHMRWFTPSSFAAMFDRAGFKVTDVGPVGPFGPNGRIISHLSGGRLDHLLMVQIAVHAIKR